MQKNVAGAPVGWVCDIYFFGASVRAFVVGDYSISLR